MFKRLFFNIFIIILLISFVIYNAISLDSTKRTIETISVEVKGYIKEEKVYKLMKNSTINDLLSIVDLYDDTDLSTISLNNVLYNNEVIVLKKKETNLISINNASEQELVTLPGVGSSMAKRIIDYRNANGSFNCIEDLMNVKGIGEKKYEKLKEFICL